MTSDVSSVLQNLISNDSELGSRLLSLLLVNSGNGQDIINAINNGNTTILNKSIDFKKIGLLKDTKENHQPIVKVRNDQKEEDKEPEDGEDTLQILKRKKNTEASARFRKRRREREIEKLNKLKLLKLQINQFNDKINLLIDENHYWKLKLKSINERKSNELLETIKRRNIHK
ncbi:hypothetical protein C6P45_003185 [Maudiozyma exigua]|uniref:BZIP domain-containing protein n=1 Tax=Maudiozyma exigua TaxID=34358 RepID=A0A9P6WC33_MAUEX|nr:hypothetical protein C6P45_003185 [Kazachstania exigua]